MVEFAETLLKVQKNHKHGDVGASCIAIIKTLLYVKRRSPLAKKRLFTLFVGAIALLAIMQPAFAGLGGNIVTVVFETFWGRAVLLILLVFFSPLIITNMVRERVAIRRTVKDLAYMATRSPEFEWLQIRERAILCFDMIRDSWDKENGQELKHYMSECYWQNRQFAFTDKRHEQTVLSHCHVKKITGITPLFFEHRNVNGPHNGSNVVVIISAYLTECRQKQGDETAPVDTANYKDVDAVWTFTLLEGKWMVSNIEANDRSVSYANLARRLPDIEDTILAKEAAA